MTSSKRKKNHIKIKPRIRVPFAFELVDECKIIKTSAMKEIFLD